MEDEQITALVDAINAAIDARLEELGVITSGGHPVKGEKPSKPEKPAKGKKGKQVEEPEHTFDEVKSALVKLVNDRDKQTAIDALTRFGCKKLGDMRKDQYDEFFEYISKLAEGDEDPADAEDLFGKDDD